MNERQGVSAPDPAHATPLRLVAAERLGRMEREAAAAVDLRAESAVPGTIVTSTNRVDALHAAVVALAARVQELSGTTASFSELLTGRHLDYSDQVRRLTLVAEQSLAEHRQTLAERDGTVERMADAVGHVSRDLAGILEQTMAALRQSREVTARNEALSEQLSDGFAKASQQLAQQSQDLREELARAGLGTVAGGSTAGVDQLRDELQGSLDQLREDIGSDLSGLRRLLSRDRAEGHTASAPARDDLDALRIDITSDMESLVRELHDDQVLMMREILASQKEIKKLRDEVGRGGGRAATNGASAEPASTPAQLENEMNRLLIELRALRRRPFIEPRATDDKPPVIPVVPKPAPRGRARLAPTARSQWAGRPMQGKNRSSR
jgi:chromosome segregation ATPase